MRVEVYINPTMISSEFSHTHVVEHVRIISVDLRLRHASCFRYSPNISLWSGVTLSCSKVCSWGFVLYGLPVQQDKFRDANLKVPGSNPSCFWSL